MELAGCSIYFALFCLEQNNLGPCRSRKKRWNTDTFQRITTIVGVLGKTHDKLEEGGIGIFGFAVLAIF